MADIRIVRWLPFSLFLPFELYQERKTTNFESPLQYYSVPIQHHFPFPFIETLLSLEEQSLPTKHLYILYTFCN